MNAKYFVTFAIGAVIGSVASWHLAKKKFEREKEEEIQSVKDSFRNKASNDISVISTENHEIEAEVTEINPVYKSITDKYNGSNATDSTYVISPEELGEHEDYKIVSLTYFECGTLADDCGTIYDPDETVGEEALSSFGEYEDDAVHVRNEALKTDYEILLDARLYSEVFK